MVRFFWMGMFLGLLLALPTMAAETSETVQNMTITYTTPSLQIDVRYPELGIKSVDEDIADWAKQMVETFKKENADIQRPEGLPTAPYSLNVDYTIFRPSAAAVSLLWEVSDYTGGAHGNLYLSTANYTLPEGRVLELQDVFTDSQRALDILSAACRRELTKLLGDGSVDMLREGTKPRIENFANFALTPTGVTVYFSPYEVAPWAAGPQEIDVSLDMLSGAGPRLALWGE